MANTEDGEEGRVGIKLGIGISRKGVEVAEGEMRKDEAAIGNFGDDVSCIISIKASGNLSAICP